jgi:hypothetical protein
MSKIKRHAPLLFLFLLAFLLRLYRFDYPLMDWHSFRQADTASVTREFVLHAYPLWQPHYHDLGNTQSGLPNPEGYRFVELPLSNYLIAIFLRAFPALNLVSFSRLASALISSLSVLLLYYLARLWQRQSLSSPSLPRSLPFLAALVMTLLPFGIYFGRTILPEPYQVFFQLLTLIFFTRYISRPRLSTGLLTALSFALALLLKPTSIFIFPVLFILAWCQWGWRLLYRFDLSLLAFLAFAPIFSWRLHLLAYPAGVPASAWLFNSDGIRLRPAWWRWLFYERLTKVWLGYFGIIFFASGLIPERLTLGQKKLPRPTFSDKAIYAWGAGLFAYLVIFATGNVRHDYYQFMFLPLISLILARGLLCLAKNLRLELNRLFRLHSGNFRQQLKATHSLVLQLFPSRLVKRSQLLKASSDEFLIHLLVFAPLLLLAVLALFFAFRLNWGKFNVNNWNEVRLGELANELLPPDALVIANGYGGDTNFLFQVARRGWADNIDLEDKIAAGADYYLGTTQDSVYQHLQQTYQLFYQNEDGYIFDLNKRLATPSGRLP